VIRTATVKDKAALQEIWSAAFGDPMDYARFAVENCLTLGTVLYHQEGMSCLTLFPVSLHRKGKRPLTGAYVYGVATHPSKQKRGYSSLLLYHTSKLAKFLVLYPATEPLHAFYVKRGFDVPVHIPAPLVKQPFTPTDNTPGTPALYADYQADALEQKSAFLWPRSLFDFAYQECLYRGGFAHEGHLCYPSSSEITCKPFLSGSKTFLGGLARFHVRTSGVRQTPPLFYLPLD